MRDPQEVEPEESDDSPTQARRRPTTVLIVEIIATVLLFVLVIGMFSGACNGPEGLQGFPGIPGEAGPVGPPGAATVTSGPPGATGDPGLAGAAGATGPSGPAGPAGPTGDVTIAAGPAGPAGPVGPVGAKGEQGPLLELRPPPGTLNNPSVNHMVFFVPEGLLVSDANGTDPPNRLGFRSIELFQKQAIRAQFAHNLESSAIKIQIDFLRTSTNQWVTLINAFGSELAPFTNQTSEWAAIPVFEGFSDFKIRVIVHGDGE